MLLCCRYVARWKDLQSVLSPTFSSGLLLLLLLFLLAIFLLCFVLFIHLNQHQFYFPYIARCSSHIQIYFCFRLKMSLNCKQNARGTKKCRRSSIVLCWWYLFFHHHHCAMCHAFFDRQNCAFQLIWERERESARKRERERFVVALYHPLISLCWCCALSFVLAISSTPNQVEREWQTKTNRKSYHKKGGSDINSKVN